MNSRTSRSASRHSAWCAGQATGALLRSNNSSSGTNREARLETLKTKLVDHTRVRYSVVMTTSLTRQQVLDLYFLDARCKLIEIAAFLDRVDRAAGSDDFRLEAFHEATRCLAAREAHRAEDVLRAFSDPTTEPIAAAPGKGAVGAWPGRSNERAQ